MVGYVNSIYGVSFHVVYMQVTVQKCKVAHAKVRGGCGAGCGRGGNCMVVMITAVVRDEAKLLPLAYAPDYVQLCRY